jgi:hypothetical protein
VADRTVTVDGKSAFAVVTARFYVLSQLENPRELQVVIKRANRRLVCEPDATFSFRTIFERKWLYNLQLLSIALLILLMGGGFFFAVV